MEVEEAREEEQVPLEPEDETPKPKAFNIREHLGQTCRYLNLSKGHPT